MLIRINLSLSYAAFHRKDNYIVNIHHIVHSALFMFVTYLKLIAFLIIYESPDLTPSPIEILETAARKTQKSSL